MKRILRSLLFVVFAFLILGDRPVFAGGPPVQTSPPKSEVLRRKLVARFSKVKFADESRTLASVASGEGDVWPAIEHFWSGADDVITEFMRHNPVPGVVPEEVAGGALLHAVDVVSDGRNVPTEANAYRSWMARVLTNDVSRQIRPYLPPRGVVEPKTIRPREIALDDVAEAELPVVAAQELVDEESRLERQCSMFREVVTRLQLDGRSRQLIAGRIRGREWKDIAGPLGMTVGNAKVTGNRALKRVEFGVRVMELSPVEQTALMLRFEGLSTDLTEISLNQRYPEIGNPASRDVVARVNSVLDKATSAKDVPLASDAMAILRAPVTDAVANAQDLSLAVTIPSSGWGAAAEEEAGHYERPGRLGTLASEDGAVSIETLDRSVPRVETGAREAEVLAGSTEGAMAVERMDVDMELIEKLLLAVRF